MELAVKTLVDHKAIEPALLEVTQICSFADYFLICSGGSQRHVIALAQHLEEALSQAGVKPLGVEGLQEGLWVLLDYNTMVIHIFFQPLRDFYNLEDLWSEAPKSVIETDRPTPESFSSSQDPLAPRATDPELIGHD